MTRTYRRKKSTRSYVPTISRNQTIARAISLYKNTTNLSINALSKKFNIPRSTLQNKINSTHSKQVGRPRTFTPQEETSFVAHLLSVSEWGFPLDGTDLKYLVKGYLDTSGRIVTLFHNNLPGDEWVSGFLKKHKAELSTRLCQNITTRRAGVDPDGVNQYFNNLKTSLEGVPVSNIINYDETNLQMIRGGNGVSLKEASSIRSVFLMQQRGPYP